MLTRRLKQLQDCGLVVRTPVPGRARAEYGLSAAGRELESVLRGLGEWGMKWARGQMRADEMDVQMLMVEFSRRLDASLLPVGRTVLEFSLPGLPRFSRWWIVIEADGTRELCANHPGHAATLTFRTDLGTLAEIWTGDLPVPTARRQGRLQVAGDPELARTLGTWLRPGALAHIRPHPDQLSV